MAEFKPLRLRLIGESDLVLHNGQLSDPLNPWTKKLKELTSKKSKTDADHEEIAKIEWYGGLYLDEKKHPCIPGEVIEGAVVAGAKKFKKGNQAKAGIYSQGNWPIMNGGADLSNIDKLFADPVHRLTAQVKVNMGRCTRTRPLFKLPWSVEVDLMYDPSVINESDVVRCMENAVAIGDWRPKFGRFKVEKV